MRHHPDKDEGSEPAAGSASGETAASPDPEPEETPFQRFEAFARKVISVPKKEIDAREREYQEKRRQRDDKKDIDQ